MGVYHVMGLGKNPGVVTVPLSLVYILQLGQALEIEKAKDFFKSSGELERKGSYEREKGMVEAVIVFTSKETIEGTVLNSCQSKWFGFGFNRGDRSYTLESVYMKFFNKLFDYFEEKFGFRPKEFRMFAVEVNHQDFEDCFKKIGTTLNALKDKEIWGSIIGGSNQINIAILTAGAYKATVSRYYYVFQSAQNLLEPEGIEKPSRENLNEIVCETIRRWQELPIFNIEIGDLLKKINEVFEGRKKVNRKEIEGVLESCGFGKQYLAKLRNFLVFKDDTVERTHLFERLTNIWGLVDESVINFSEWKKWAEENTILHEIQIF
ncbi:MAG: hypothetical protein QW089_06375 [Archaeoglobaceae archaeon]